MRTFLGVFGVADHESGIRFAEIPRLPGVFDMYLTNCRENRKFNRQYDEPEGRFGPSCVRLFRTVTTEKKIPESDHFLPT